MERYNFDVIFEGTNEEQHCRASHFVRGLQRKIRQADESYAHAVLVGENSRVKLGQIHELEDAQNAFAKDPRTLVLQKWVDEKLKSDRADQIAKLFKDALTGT